METNSCPAPYSPRPTCFYTFSCLTHRPWPQADNDYTLAANLCALSPYYLLLFMPFPLFTSLPLPPAAVAVSVLLLLLTRHFVVCKSGRGGHSLLCHHNPQSTHTHTSNSQWALLSSSSITVVISSDYR